MMFFIVLYQIKVILFHCIIKDEACHEKTLSLKFLTRQGRKAYNTNQLRFIETRDIIYAVNNKGTYQTGCIQVVWNVYVSLVWPTGT